MVSNIQGSQFYKNEDLSLCADYVS